MLVFVAGGVVNASGQTGHSDWQSEHDFLEYLMMEGLYEEAVTWVDLLKNRYGWVSDSAQWYQGQAFLELRKFTAAASVFHGLTIREGQFKGRSTLLYQYCLAQTTQYDKVDSLINERLDSPINDLLRVQAMGISLLSRDYETVDSFGSNFYPQIETTYLELKRSYLKVPDHSPLVSGMLSAILPGLGKVYHGKPLQGLAAFFSIALLSIQAWDGYRDKQWDSPQFYIYGSLAAGFYIGNIWGSVLSAKIIKHERLTYLDNEVQVQLRIPVDDVLGF